MSGVGEEFVQAVMQKYNLKQKDILLLSVSGQDEFYLQPIEKEYITGKIDEVNNDGN